MMMQGYHSNPEETAAALDEKVNKKETNQIYFGPQHLCNFSTNTYMQLLFYAIFAYSCQSENISLLAGNLLSNTYARSSTHYFFF